MSPHETTKPSSKGDVIESSGKLHAPHIPPEKFAGALASCPIYVDLDGTLIASDLLWEAIPACIKASPAEVWKIPIWLLRGKTCLKWQLAQRVMPDVAMLPYRADVLSWLRGERRKGRTLVLATASPRRWALAVAEHLALFDDVLASTDEVNLKGEQKLGAIVAHSRARYGGQFEYVGDAAADLPIWGQAAMVHAVGVSRGLLRQLRQLGRPLRHFPQEMSALPALLAALRPQQWLKNLLLWVPLVLAHVFTVDRLLLAALATAAFCLTASGVYVINDWLDVAADRRHPRKRRRPFASGALPLSWGPGLAAASLSAGGALAIAALPPSFAALLGTYLLLTCLYSFWLKQRPIVDVLLLAGLYTLRILAGGVATEIAVSEWLLAFSVFMFTSLALAKRYAELTRLEHEGAAAAPGRGYIVADRDILRTFGPCAGYLAVMVLSLYINSDAVRRNFAQPGLLWPTAGLLLYWVTRLWFLGSRGALHEDPVVFAVTDRVSLGVLFVAGIFILGAAFL